MSEQKVWYIPAYEAQHLHIQRECILSEIEDLFIAQKKGKHVAGELYHKRLELSIVDSRLRTLSREAMTREFSDKIREAMK